MTRGEETFQDDMREQGVLRITRGGESVPQNGGRLPLTVILSGAKDPVRRSTRPLRVPLPHVPHQIVIRQPDGGLPLCRSSAIDICKKACYVILEVAFRNVVGELYPRGIL